MAGAYSAYGIKRYMDETRRLFDVLESRLANNDWLAGNKYTLADIASYSWVQSAPVFLDFKLADWPGIERWTQRIMDRPAVKKAHTIPEGTRTRAEMTQFAKGMREKVDAMKDTNKDS
jgi:glutathione S-transferase